jgi:hypothetical protein
MPLRVCSRGKAPRRKASCCCWARAMTLVLSHWLLRPPCVPSNHGCKPKRDEFEVKAAEFASRGKSFSRPQESRRGTVARSSACPLRAAIPNRNAFAARDHNAFAGRGKDPPAAPERSGMGWCAESSEHGRWLRCRSVCSARSESTRFQRMRAGCDQSSRPSSFFLRVARALRWLRARSKCSAYVSGMLRTSNAPPICARRSCNVRPYRCL